MRPSMYETVVGAILLSVLFPVCIGGSNTPSHYFLRQPALETTVRLGDRAILQCAVANMQSSVQWTADGFGLGTELDGRLQFVGDTTKGEYNLLINNTQLSDDGYYECQVAASLNGPGKHIRSRHAHLTVLVPPKDIILAPVKNGIIDIKYPTSVEVTCVAPDTKPASEITWKVAGKIFSDVINAKTSLGRADKLITVSSRITLSSETIRNGSSVECIVDHQALDVAASKMAILNILHPPSRPVITGITSEPIQVGEDIEVKCLSTGGNPPANITWAIGDDIHEGVYQAIGDKALSTLRYTPKRADNGKRLKCVVRSPALSSPLQAQKQFEVYYPPESVIIEQDPIDGVEENEEISYICYNTDSNPSPILDWFIDDVKLPNKTSDSNGAIPFHTYIITDANSEQRIALTLRRVRREDSDLLIRCRASIPKIGYNREVTIRPKLNYPPRNVSVTIENPLRSPMINVHPQNESFSSEKEVAFIAGDSLMLSCEAKGGSPAPDLRWFVKRNDKTEQIYAMGSTKVKVETRKNAGDSIFGELITTSSVEIELKPSHNKARILCEASHSQYKGISSADVTLNVAFPPDSLHILQFPATPTAGKHLSLTCRTASSYPPATISWYKDRRLINSESLENLPLANGKYGGFISSNRLSIFAEVADDGSSYTCEATVDPLEETIIQQYTISVEYAPRFHHDQKMVYNSTVGTSYLEIKIKVSSNPDSITFNWFRYVRSKNTSRVVLHKVPLRSSRFIWIESSRILHINNLKQGDDGIYEIQAANARGSVEANITINVFYSPKIIRMIGPSTLKNQGDAAILRCDFNSHHLTQPRVVWVKEVPGIGRPEYNINTYKGHSILSLTNLTAEDRGGYKCIVDNGIGDGDAKSVTISLTYGPVFDESTPQKVAVSYIQGNGILTPKASLQCLVYARPNAIVEWRNGNHIINSTTAKRFSIVRNVVDEETVRSTLVVSQLIASEINRSSDADGTLGEFSCKASNTRGTRIQDIKIVLQGPPDTPFGLFSYNKTDTAITLAWNEGFDGGSKQTFIVEYQIYSRYLFAGKFQETRSKSNELTVSGLNPDKEYMFRVLAENIQGKSGPSDLIRVRTGSAKEMSSTPQIEGVQTARIISFSAAAAAVIFVVILTSVLIYRRCNASKQSYRPKTIETDCESLHAETSLSSRCSTSKSPEGEKMTEEQDIIELQSMSECKQHLLETSEDLPSISTENYSNAHEGCFERPLSRCSNGATIFKPWGCDVKGGCTFSSFKSLPETNVSPSRSLFDFRNKREKYAPPITTDKFSRSNLEAKFRFDVAPTAECSVDYSDNIRDSYSDVQLPPPLQPYQGARSSSVRSKVESFNDISRDDYQLQALFSKEDHDKYPSGIISRYYHTLTTANRSACQDVASEKCFPEKNYVDMRQKDPCSYNTMSKPSNSNFDLNLGTEDCRRGAPQHHTSTNVEYSRIENATENATGRCQDVVMPTNTADFPPPPPEIIKQPHCQEMLSSNYSYRKTGPQSNGEIHCANEYLNMPGDTMPQNKFTQGRSSLRGNNDNTINRRAPTPSVKFRDDLSKGLSNQYSTSAPTHSRQITSNFSDDDADSGCGGSADVQVHRTVSPDHTPRFSPLSHSADGKGMELRV